MLLFGNAGVTLGAATVLANLPLVQARNSAGKQLNAEREESERSPLDRVAKLVDIRLLLIGSLLPDIIDKPLMFAVPGLGGGHGLAHGLLFLALMSLSGLFLFIGLRQTWMLGCPSERQCTCLWTRSGNVRTPCFGCSIPSTKEMSLTGCRT